MNRKLCAYLVAAISPVASAQWESIASPPTAGASRLYAAGVTAGGSIYAIGGTPWQNGADQDGVVHRYSGGVWTTTAPVDGLGPIIGGAAGVDALGNIIVYGGYVLGDGGTGEAKIYDPVEGANTNVAERTAPEDSYGLFAWARDDAGRLYGLGGGPGEGGPNSGYCDRYDALSDSWTVLAPMLTPAADACAVNDGQGHILVVGGINAAGNARLSNVARYDVATDSWSDSALPDLPVALSGARAVLGADGQVYVLGGESGAIGAGLTQASVYVLNQSHTAWSPSFLMSTPRKWFAATLGDDDYIYAIGGDNDDGGTDAAERLFTPQCPVFVEEPASTNAWAGTIAGMNVIMSGAEPFTYQWRHEGVPLVDGPTGTGSTIEGADTASLVIHTPGAADEGLYDIVVTNACGTVTSTAATLTLRQPPTSPSAWTVTNIHPSGALGSTARSVSGDRIGGSKTIPTDLGDTRIMNLEHPVLWDRGTLVPTTITPAGSVGGAVYDVEGDLATGWFWHTWSCWGGTQYWTCAWTSACVWPGQPPIFDEVHLSGAEYDTVYATDGIDAVGTVTYEYSEGNYDSKAYLWRGPNFSPLNMHPSWAGDSFLSGMDDTHEYGHINTPNPGSTSHAAIWTGSASSCVDVNPAGYHRSFIVGAHEGLGVGSAYVGGVPHAGVWLPSGAFLDLNPPGASGSSLSATHSGVQVGSGPGGAGVWFGTPESFTLIGDILPTGFTSGFANDVYVDPDGTITVVGNGYNAATGRNEAIVWRSVDVCPSDFNGDGQVNGIDVGLFLQAYGTQNPSADMNGDGNINGIDVGLFLQAYGQGC